MSAAVRVLPPARAEAIERSLRRCKALAMAAWQFPEDMPDMRGEVCAVLCDELERLGTFLKAAAPGEAK